MSYEVHQVVGEGDEEDETIQERPPEVDLEVTLESYKHSEIAQLHLIAHSLIQEQKSAMKFTNLEIPSISKIDEYLNKLKHLQKRKVDIEKRSTAVKTRLHKIMTVLESRSNKPK